MVNGVNYLLLEKARHFDDLLNRHNPYRKASKEEVEKVFAETYGNLEEVVTTLLNVGLFLMPQQTIDTPEELPHIVSKWPIIYDHSPKSELYGKSILGYVKAK